MSWVCNQRGCEFPQHDVGADGTDLCPVCRNPLFLQNDYAAHPNPAPTGARWPSDWIAHEGIDPTTDEPDEVDEGGEPDDYTPDEVDEGGEPDDYTPDEEGARE